MKTMMRDNPGKAGSAWPARGRLAALLACVVLSLAVPGAYLRGQSFEICRTSVLLSWPEPPEEQIVVGASSPNSTAVWTPWPEPIFKRFGQLCMAVPINTTVNAQFFKLVPGRQFVDDFSDTWGPFTNRNSWMSMFQNPGEEWAVTNGVLQVDFQANEDATFGLLPLGTNDEAKLRDIYTSVDILNWVTSGANRATFFLEVRATLIVDGALGYAGGLNVNADDIRGKVMLWLVADAPLAAPIFDAQEFPPPYRLQFSVVGTRLSLRLLSLTTGEVIRELGVNSTTYTHGLSGVAFDGRSNPGDFYTVRFDNFFLSGTKP